MEMLKSIGKTLLSAILTEAFIKEIIVFLLEKIAAQTSNTVDDELVKKVKEALQAEKVQEAEKSE